MDERKALLAWLLFTLLSAACSQDDTVCGGDGKIKDWKAKDGYCYKAFSSAYTWHDAKTQCAKSDSYLFSVTSDEELKFLLELLKDSSFSRAKFIWTGLNALAPDGTLAWDDGTPLIYDDWDPKIEEDPNRNKCGRMSTSDGMWSLDNCNTQSFGFICKSRKPGFTTQPPPVTEPLPGHCPRGWANYGNKCFKLFNEQVSWDDAKARCKKENEKTGHLASIHNDMETMLVSTLLNAAGTNAWIGLSRLSSNKYIWEDNSNTDYDNWNRGRFTPMGRPVCVEMMNLALRPGHWNAIYCSDKRAFVCQMGKDKSLTTPEPPNQGKCDNGYVEYKDDCYIAVTSPAARKSWTEAESACSALGESAHLVSILDAFQLAFLALTFTSSEPVWIGYSDHLDQKLRKFAWKDKWPTTFTNWDQNQPDMKTTSVRCTYMSYGGRWSVSDCDQPKGYICRVTDKSPPVIPKIPGSCPPGNWFDIGNSVCYQIVTAGASFSSAQSRCKTLDKLNNTGRLASFHSQLELDMVTHHLTDLSVPLWIGLAKSKISGRFEWTDQTPLDFLNWQNGEPSNGRMEDCVEMYAQSMKWNDVLCSGYKGYICAADKTFRQVEVEQCGGDGSTKDWKAVDGYCYTTTYIRNSWHDAKKTCADFDSNLVSISSEDEMNLLLQLLKDRPSQSDKYVWIGLNSLAPDGTFGWDDGTPLILQDWSPGIPEDQNRNKCVKMSVTDGSWLLDDCNGVRMYSICKIRQPGHPTEPPPVTEPLPGHCPKGWSNFGNKCYKLFGRDEPLSWDDASSRCRAQDEKTGHLASVHNGAENMVLTTLLDEAGVNAWIGFRKTRFGYMWEDSSKSDYVAWNEGRHEPWGMDVCVEMMNFVLRPGKWNPLPCEVKKPYICQRAKDPSLTTPEPPNRGKCDEDYVEYKGDCYMAITRKVAHVTWAAAEDACKALGNADMGSSAHLVSVLNPFQQAFLTLTFPSAGPLWIGYSDKHDEFGDRFLWSDKWPTTYTNWDENQPELKSGKRCTAMSYGGSWAVADCSETKGYLCRLTLKTPPEVPIVSGSCPSGDWSDIGTSKCYKVVTKTENFEGARTKCQQMGGTLASLHTQVELDMLGPVLAGVKNHMWIGLRRDQGTGRFQWMDESPVDFANWSPNEPSLGSEYCVEMYAQTMQWNDNGCYRSNAYICAVQKASETKPTKAPSGQCGTDGIHDTWLPNEDNCYHLVYESQLTWHAAKQECERFKSTLVSIKDSDEMEYLVNLLRDGGFPIKQGRVWIGLTALRGDGNFAWVDGTPLSLEEWGKEAMEPDREKKCAFMDMKEEGAWGLERCNAAAYNFICKVRKPGLTTETPVTPTPMPGYCRKGWATYGNKCYKLFGKDEPLTWDDARAKCKAEDENSGHLVSIHSDMENLVLTTLVDAAGVSAWIGFKYNGQFWHEYVWEDNTGTDFVAWNKGKHEPITSNRCVEIMKTILRAGKWNPLPCSDKRSFICQMNRDPTVTTPETPFSGKCGGAYLEYKDDCYTAVLNKGKPWQQAEEACMAESGAKGSSAHLTSVTDPFLQAFLAVYYQSTKPLWIGYADHVIKGAKEFGWVDKWPTTFTNWDENQPNLNSDSTQCTAMSLGGRWSTADCAEDKGYICRITNKPAPVVPRVEGSCPSSAWADVGTSTCYLISERRTNFESARSECEKMIATSARLASFHSMSELDLLRPHLADLESHLWIGLVRDQQKREFVWTDQSPNDFFNWADGEPTNVDEEGCVELYAHDMTWNDNSCYKYKGYICAATKNVTTPTDVTTAEPMSCSPDLPYWTYFNGYCYFVQEYAVAATDWHDSEKFCNDMGGYLVSIHGEEEDKFVFDFLSKRQANISIWTGLHAFRSDSGFKWTDQSVHEFTRLDHAELQEGRCVALEPKSREWVPSHCGKPFGLMCKHAHGETSFTRTTPGTTRAPGGCPSGWRRAGNRCYALQNPEPGKGFNWAMAKATCRSQGENYDLASIHSPQEQAAVNSLLSSNLLGVWIGLSRVISKDMSVFGWADNSAVDFTNWAPREPSNKRDACVEMMVTNTRAGKWNDEDCSEPRPFICQSILDSDNREGTEATKSGNCTDPDMREFSTGCFRIFANERVGWEEAERKCKATGAQLASVNSPFEQAFLYTLAQEDPSVEAGLWLGLSSQNGIFRWSDGWPVYYTNWGSGEPQTSGTSACTYLDSQTKDWRTQPCDKQMGFVCKVNKDPVPVVPEPKRGMCPDYWTDVGLDRCVFIEHRNTTLTAMSWDEADLDCLDRGNGSELASFHSPHELDVLTPHLQDSHFELWIGLQRKDHGGYEWSDLSPVDFQKWGKNEPTQGKKDNCIGLDPVDMTWQDRACSNKLGHICMIAKFPLRESGPPDDSHSARTASIVVGVVLGVVFLAVAVAMIIKMRRKQPGGVFSFENVLFQGKSSDTKRLT